LRVFDVTTPSRPLTRGSLPGSVRGVAMAGNATAAYARIMVTGNPGHIDLAIVDIRTPTAPRIVSQIYIPGGSGVAVSGSYLYVGAGTDGLKVYDLTQPLAPSSAAPYRSPAARTWSRPRTLCLRDERQLGRRGRCADAEHAARRRLVSVRGAGARDLRHAPLCDHDGQLAVLNVSNPAAPSLLGTSSSYAAQGVAANGTLAYLTSPTVDRADGDGGLYLVDTATATAPTLRGHVLGGSTTRASRSPARWPSPRAAASTAASRC
jgi:hypothetical protein